MNRWLAGSGLTLLFLATSAAAYELETSGTTLIRYSKQSVPGFAAQQLLPATQLVDVSMSRLGDGNLSFQLSGWGRIDMADQSDVSGSAAASLTNAFFAYTFPRANAEVKVGRFFVFAGGTAEQLDGISARSDLLERYEGLALHLYTGRPVNLARTVDNKGNFLAGGRLSYRFSPLLELGATMVHEQGATSYRTDSPQSLPQPATDARQQLGGDLWFSPGQLLTVEGRAYYNPVSKGMAEQSCRLTLRPLNRLSIIATYDQRSFSNYFATASNPSLFKPLASQELTSTGASAAYILNDQAEITADLRQFKRSTIGTGTRGGGELRLTLHKALVRSGLGYHRLGAPDGVNSYHELRSYLAYDPGSYQISIDAIGHQYDYPVYLNSSRLAHEVTMSAGYRLKPNLLLSADLTTSRSPQAGDEIKGLLRLDFSQTTLKPGVGL